MEPGESSWVGGERSWNGIFTNLGNFTIGEHEFKKEYYIPQMWKVCYGPWGTFPEPEECVLSVGECVLGVGECVLVVE